MELKSIFDILFNIGDYLETLAQSNSIACYIIIFVVVFCETGLVVTPFLPGDSLLFTIGLLAATSIMKLEIIIPIAGFAAVSGDTANYCIGRVLGKKLFSKDKSIFFNEKFLKRAEDFYQRHGRKTIIITRFIPILRTFAPFVAGIGKMEYGQFILYNLIGGLSWVLILCLGGFYFGALPVVKDNFPMALAVIIIISLLPVVITVIKSVVNKLRARGPDCYDCSLSNERKSDGL